MDGAVWGGRSLGVLARPTTDGGISMAIEHLRRVSAVWVREAKRAGDSVSLRRQRRHAEKVAAVGVVRSQLRGARAGRRRADVPDTKNTRAQLFALTITRDGTVSGPMVRYHEPPSSPPAHFQ